MEIRDDEWKTAVEAIALMAQRKSDNELQLIHLLTDVLAFTSMAVCEVHSEEAGTPMEDQLSIVRDSIRRHLEIVHRNHAIYSNTLPDRMD